MIYRCVSLATFVTTALFGFHHRDGHRIGKPFAVQIEAIGQMYFFWLHISFATTETILNNGKRSNVNW